MVIQGQSKALRQIHSLHQPMPVPANESAAYHHRRLLDNINCDMFMLSDTGRGGIRCFDAPDTSPIH